MIAVRDNEGSAAAYTVSPTRMKLVAFAIAGGIAALAGGLLSLANTTTQPAQFPPTESLLVLSVAVVGGITSITGAVLGTLIVVGIPTIFDGTDEVKLFASAVGMLVIVLYFPDGIIGLVHRARDGLLEQVARRTGWQPRRHVDKRPVAVLCRGPRRRDLPRARAAHRPMSRSASVGSSQWTTSRSRWERARSSG